MELFGIDFFWLLMGGLSIILVYTIIKKRLSKKTCQKCGKKRVIEIGDALYVAKVGKAVAQREFCFCG